MCRPGMCNQPVGARYPSNRSMGETGTSRSASSAVSADNLHLVPSEAQTRVTQDFKLAHIPTSAVEGDTTVSLSLGSRVSGGKTTKSSFRVPLFYFDVRGRDRSFTAMLDTGAAVTVARVSVARRGNVSTQKIDPPEPLCSAFGGQPIFCYEFARLELHRHCEPNISRCIKVYLLEDNILRFADAYMAPEDAESLGWANFWRRFGRRE
ncbi:hypothetical protein CLAIMM_00565 isoform 3 [Cladophialophora immunda]|nr:hypothetical protein CLAIMM_00565 isoform 1 [Cladophialophora immunda]OQU94170.1 hypothetical protein CLAIMM_00565 isoform 3 [Cladophialophora immunda]